MYVKGYCFSEDGTLLTFFACLETKTSVFAAKFPCKLQAAASADMLFLLATKIPLFAAEGLQRKPRGNLCASLRGGV